MKTPNNNTDNEMFIVVTLLHTLHTVQVMSEYNMNSNVSRDLQLFANDVKNVSRKEIKQLHGFLSNYYGVEDNKYEIDEALVALLRQSESIYKDYLRLLLQVNFDCILLARKLALSEDREIKTCALHIIDKRTTMSNNIVSLFMSLQ